MMNNTNTTEKWEFWIDRGGTFTDIVALTPEQQIITHKLLSDNPEQYKDAAIQGIRELLNLDTHERLPTKDIKAVKMGTTVATNALLEREGEPTVLAITHGFGDALRIGFQTRPDLFALDIKLPEMLYGEVVEINERIDAKGEILTALEEFTTFERLQAAYFSGFRAIAIILMHGYRFTKHEKRVADIAKEIGFTQISVSHEVSPLMKLVPRGDTTVIDAYLSPVLRRYVDKVSSELHKKSEQKVSLMFMQSSGGLTDASSFQGKDAILSGPAGGVVGMARTAELAGFDKIIGFDMGGTSTDVSHYNGEFERTFESQVAGIRVRAPMMLIHTVAAGGGSLLKFDGSRYRVGPDSAGANPGPACYRNGGPLTITDCNVLLGKLQPDFFPKVFGTSANQPFDCDVVNEKFHTLSQEIEIATGNHRKPEAVAEGFLAVAVDSMASAIKKISVQRGYDVTQYTLSCFGGAGGQHACLVADALGVSRILVHPHAGVLSAFGMGLADITTQTEHAIEKELNEATLMELIPIVKNLQLSGETRLLKQGAILENLCIRSFLQLRYLGSDTTLTVELDSQKEVVAEFEEKHQKRFGFTSPEKAMIVESIEVNVIWPAQLPEMNFTEENVNSDNQLFVERDCYMQGEWRCTRVYKRKNLIQGRSVNGPAIIIDPTGTNVIEIGWRAEITASYNLILDRYLPLPERKAIGTRVDPVMLEIFNNLFMSIADQMGTVLEFTSESVNIKERLDFSCAVFDASGALVANAPHMPVHLGSMGESVKAVIDKHGKSMKSGDAYILNSPYCGGTHLPDITIVKPVFINNSDIIIFYTATRGHHADIGGKSPGSAPSDSKNIHEEGVIIDNLKLVSKNKLNEYAMRQLLESGEWPARNVDMNIADIKAQLAACEKGVQELCKMVDNYGSEVVNAYMQHVQDNAEESVRRVIEVLKNGEFCYEMDDGNQICVAITVDRDKRSATIDFTGTSGQHPTNYNAPSAVTRAAVLYVFRCLVNDQIPLNEGCLKPLNIIIPKRTMISPEYPAAVIAGNVETSQYLVDTLFAALGVMAASQGTMNNTFWGNDQYQYYETVCGGSGATKKHHGASAVHTHMTNSRLTDPEILEWRFPVLLEEFSIRKGSGGKGMHTGGNGVVRRVQFLEKMEMSILAGHHRVPPYGMENGASGSVGRCWIQRNNNTKEILGSTASAELYPGDRLTVETPGGGGYGKITESSEY